MRLLDRLIVREIAGPFLFGVAAFASVFFAGKDLLVIIGDIVKGLPLATAGELLLLQMPYILVLVLPMSVLLGTLLAFSRLSGESEIVALYAGGISLYRIVVLALGLGLAVSILTFALNEFIAPRANARARQIRVTLLKEQVVVEKPVPLADIKDGVTRSIVYVQGGLDKKTRTLRDVSLVIFQANRPRVFFFAKRARWEGGYDWKLYDGYMQTIGPSKTGEWLVATEQYREWRTRVALRHTPEEFEIYNKKSSELTFGQLLGHIRRLNARGAPTIEEELDLYDKLTIPFSAFVFALLACSLGLRPHRGGSSVGLGLSILIIFAYWIVWHFGSAMASQGTIPPALGSFSASLLALGAGSALLVRAAK